MDRKYKLIKSDIRGLYRIKALRDFGDVKKWDIGGYVKNENNLSHSGNCWVYDNAIVCDNAIVYNNARVYQDAQICDDARIFNDVLVAEKARVCGHARIYNDVRVLDSAIVDEYSQIYNHVKIHDYATIKGKARIYDYATINDEAIIYGSSVISGNAYITGDTEVEKGVHIGYLEEKFKNVLYIQGKNRLITVYKDINNIIKCNIGCQRKMTLSDLINRIKKDGGMNEHREEYVRIMENAHLLLG